MKTFTDCGGKLRGVLPNSSDLLHKKSLLLPGTGGDGGAAAVVTKD